MSVSREFRGIDPPAGVKLPTTAEIIAVCTKRGRRTLRGLAYPSDDRPVCWIKYGNGVTWNEVHALALARQELLRLRSPVAVPAVYHAFEADYVTYIVMEYIHGRTGTQILESTSVPAEREAVYRHMAAGVQELLRIPIPPKAPPSAFDNGVFSHIMFLDLEAPRRYQNTDQLEQHLNVFLEKARSKLRLKGLSNEPMVFCFSDIHPGNFIISDDGRVTIIDFSETSILPCSFAKYAIISSWHNPEYNIAPWIDIPGDEGVENTYALFEASRKLAPEYPALNLDPSLFYMPGVRVDREQFPLPDPVSEYSQ
ncbi:uncharacterized protein MCYG_07960 [Microsporum canis CBS 113480]|uniref:Aminoglycoside phosphotransferase domain-containing protein n=1 Tax=Arthroderma otae (strain ATCC MYA-4605 / CBS 113480) TaxID=554155 RepID=C5FZ38_ARTOC|nr:uncharacterized protein MCYG_07960 [Microsporum canis CBS 113480]EEQ35141.1 predicted protein [Microsporum canis CBS 113480]